MTFASWRPVERFRKGLRQYGRAGGSRVVLCLLLAQAEELAFDAGRRVEPPSQNDAAARTRVAVERVAAAKQDRGGRLPKHARIGLSGAWRTGRDQRR